MRSAAEWFHLGFERHQANDLPEAAACYRASLKLEPKSPLTAYNLGVVLHTLGQLSEAERAYRDAAKLKSDFAEAHNNLGNLLAGLGRLGDALASYQAAVAAKPALLEAQLNLGQTLLALGRPQEARGPLQRVLDHQPGNLAAWRALLETAERIANTELVSSLLERALAGATPPAPICASLFRNIRRVVSTAPEARLLEMLPAVDFSIGTLEEILAVINSSEHFALPHELQQQLHAVYADRASKEHTPEVPLQLPRRTAPGGLRIAILVEDSANDAAASLATLAARVTQSADVSLHLFRIAGSPESAPANANGRAVSLAALDDFAAARAIAQIDADLLLDTTVGGVWHRPSIAAYRPARHVVAWPFTALRFPYENESGDGLRLGDLHAPLASPVPRRRHSTGPSRAAFVCASEAVTVSPACVAAWAKVLRACPDATFLVTSALPIDRRAVAERLTAAGVPAERIVDGVVANRVGQEERLIFLDPFPGGDLRAALRALASGIPVVTLDAGASSPTVLTHWLQSHRLGSLVAANESAYVEAAKKLADQQTEYDKAVEAIEQTAAPEKLAAFGRGFVEALRARLMRSASEAAQTATMTAAEFNERLKRAVQAHQRNELAEALAHYEALRTDQPEYAPIWYLSAMAEKAHGDARTARSMLQKAVELSPRYFDAHLALARLLSDQGEHLEASNRYAQAVALRPNDADAMTGLAFALQAANRMAEASRAFARAVQLRPSDADLFYNAGVVAQKLERFDEALAYYSRAVTIAPKHTDALLNIGVLFHEYHRYDDAITSYRRLLEIEPQREVAYTYAGETLRAAGRVDEWVELFRQFERSTQPSWRLALMALEVTQHLGDYKTQARYLKDLVAGRYPFATAQDAKDCLEELLYLMLFFDLEESDYLKLYRDYDRVCSEIYEYIASQERTPRDRVRLGYLSGDFRDHVMGKMMYAPIAGHDKRRFEIICYSLSPKHDAWTDAFKRAADAFVDLHALSDVEAAQRIARDDVDILVDLSTHTKGARAGILAQKPARVQMTHAASAGAVGLSAIDFKLTDAYADLPENQSYHLERLVAMPGCVYPFRPISAAPRDSVTRAGLGIKSNAFVFGEFVTLMKLSPRMLKTWAEILKRLPHAVLAFSPTHDGYRSSYLRCVQTAGIVTNRVVFVPQAQTEEENQARYGLIDAVLDTFPYGGVNGTLEAINASVPVVTLCGRKHGERQGYTILSNLGVNELIAQSEREYIELACRLAEDATWRQTLHERIDAARETSTLCDTPGYISNLEHTYLSVIETAKSPT